MFRLMLMLILLFFPLTAAQASEHRLTYDVYAGGVHAMQANLSINQKKSAYKLSLNVETYGLLKSLADWRGRFSSHGVRVSSALHKPRQHISEAIWRGELEKKTYNYNQAGHLISYTVIENGQNRTPEDTDPSLFKNTTDILSATLDVIDDLRVNDKGNKTRTIFDGDRNFNAIFKAAGTEILKQTKYNIYAGKSILCTIEVKPNGGKWHKKPRGWLSIQEQGRKAGTMPTIWFAKLSADPSAPYMPVKLRVKTDYGTLFMHLTSYKDSIKPPSKGKKTTP